MPPWFAGHEFGPFVNRRGLTDEERATITDWVRSGAAAGDLAKAPAAARRRRRRSGRSARPTSSSTPSAFDLPATGDIPYKYAVLPHLFAEDTWVQGVQITADNPRSLHHCNMAFAKPHRGVQRGELHHRLRPRRRADEPRQRRRVPAFPKGSVLGLQIHFVTTGKPEKCKVSVGLRYPRDVVHEAAAATCSSPTRASRSRPARRRTRSPRARVLDHDVVGVGLFSHMHLRGKDMTFTAHPPDGKPETLLVIPNYNFSWQIPYRWEPGKKTLPKGTRLECVAHFDNSPFNPYNPNPKATVRNGPQTHHEMMYGFFFYTDADGEARPSRSIRRTGRSANRPVESLEFPSFERAIVFFCIQTTSLPPCRGGSSRSP